MKILAPLFALLLILTGCSISSPTVTPDPDASVSAIQPTQTPPAPNNFTENFGKVISWTDGLSVSVSEPVEFTPTETAMGPVAGFTNVIFKIVLTNNTPQPFSPALVWSRVSSGGLEAQFIADSGNVEYGPLDLGPSTVVLPGQTIEWYTGFAVADPTNITFQVSREYPYDSAIFTNIPF